MKVVIIGNDIFYPLWDGVRGEKNIHKYFLKPT